MSDASRRGSAGRSEPRSYKNNTERAHGSELEWRVAATGGEGAAAAAGLLLAADGCGDEIFDRVGCGVVPALGEWTAARPGGERCRGVGDGLLRIANQYRRRCVGEIGIR